MASNHIVKSYDEDLALLKTKLSEMGSEVEDQIIKANQALVKRNGGLADLVIFSDQKVNVLQQEAEELGVLILATRQPVAQDLRAVIAALKMASELERIADYAANIARHTPDLDHDLDLDQPLAAITQMAELAKTMLSDIMAAFADGDVQKAIAVWHRDDRIDSVYADLLSDLRTRMSQDSEHIQSYTGLIFVARCCERIGDHITNLAENVHYIERAKTYIDGKVPLS
ncbi:Phosphate transport system regulatory protein PhoU [Olavius algarvensis Delta 1 endosymbiont]|nr:Phosphate transport system regulatory protein PhoU [Olavius algarvensis Delta 1 endosymbiont]